MAIIESTAPSDAEREHRKYWNGVDRSFIPAGTLRVPDGLKLHSEADTEIDPITFEVVRHSLWNANEEHGSIITNLAVSPITLETRDFQTAIITADGEILFFGPYLQYLAGFMDMVVKFIIEQRGNDVKPGDMWLVNDPWIGTAHQPDVNLLCPVFVGDELFCWVANNVHQNDIGGTVPGSFCTNAQDAFWDPVSIPPCRIVRDGEIQRDVEDFYRRQSRTPVNIALDLRACIAGNNAARDRILGMTKRYGAATVKGVMNGLLDASQSAFTNLLETIPDGEWHERCYQEVAVTGDRGSYRIEMQLRKEGDRLIFANKGTDPEVGAINLTFGAHRGTTLAAINVLVLAEQMGVIGGAARQIDYEPESGTITCCDYGVAVSPAGVYANELMMAMANAVVTKMLLCSSSEAVRAKALASTPGQWHLHIHAGNNQRGAYYVGPMLDAIIGTTGATATADGDFANGVWWIPEGRGPNVETYERDWPILYLYRREDSDSGGAGRFRGGNGGRIGYIPHGGEMGVGVYPAEGLPKSPGILGALPGSIGETVLLQGSDIRAQLAAGNLPSSVEGLTGTRVPTQGKGDPLLVDDDSVMEWNWGGSAGYGDPLTREPARVAADLAAGQISAEVADREYGVVIAGDAVDEAATQERRTALRKARLAGAGIDREPAARDFSVADGTTMIGADIALDQDAGTYRCAYCGDRLGSLDGHTREHVAVWEHSVQEIGPRFSDPSQYIDQELVYREILCCGCGHRFGTEVSRPEDDLVVDFRIHAS
jgi:N-methylhydantoinase B